MNTNTTQIAGYIAIAAILISLFFIGTKFTGFATTSTQTGLVNVTIDSSAGLNFSIALLDFANGTVDGGASFAVIDSEGTAVTDGSWATVTGALVLENIGNVNVSLNLSTNKSAADFIGGDSPSFKAKTKDQTGNTGACTGTRTWDSSFVEITTTSQIACSVFGFDNAVDEINITFELTIPNDATGAKTVGIVAIGTY